MLIELSLCYMLNGSPVYWGDRNILLAHKSILSFLPVIVEGDIK